MDDTEVVGPKGILSRGLIHLNKFFALHTNLGNWNIFAIFER